MSRDDAGARRILLGQIVGVHGVRGWVRIHSDTDPREGILRYREWQVGPDGAQRRVLEGKRHGKGLIALIEGCDDRDRAAALIGQEIAVDRDRLPPPQPDEFYWCDLEGLTVSTTAGDVLGQVDHLFATGSNDVMVIEGERQRLIPFLWDRVVKSVDFEQRHIQVDWDPDF